MTALKLIFADFISVLAIVHFLAVIVLPDNDSVNKTSFYLHHESIFHNVE
jgi:hypothetical protein